MAGIAISSITSNNGLFSRAKQVDDISVRVGNRKQLTVTTEPNTNTESLVYMSSNEGVVKVDSSGYVTGISAGTATITVKGSKTSSVQTICTVKVKYIPTGYVEETLSYPIITSDGVCNVKYVNPSNSAEFVYDFDGTIEPTGTNVLPTVGYDGNLDTQTNSSTHLILDVDGSAIGQDFEIYWYYYNTGSAGYGCYLKFYNNQGDQVGSTLQARLVNYSNNNPLNLTFVIPEGAVSAEIVGYHEPAKVKDIRVVE